jgi:hypothetical protein
VLLVLYYTRELLEYLHRASNPLSTCCDREESNNTETVTDYSRFIPNREGQDLQASFSLLHDEGSPATPSKQKKRTPHGELHFQKSKLEMKCSDLSDADHIHS